MTTLLDHFQSHRKGLSEAAQDSRFTVFLCGPALPTPASGTDVKPSAELRAKLICLLRNDHFDVVLGEDDGLTEAQLCAGVNAQDNELEFIRNHCDAIVVIADSVGSFCELGLFSWHYVHEKGVIDPRKDFILLVDKMYEEDRSYLNEGPFSSVAGFGKACFVDLRTYSCEDVLRRLRLRRGVYTVDRRNRLPTT